MVLKKKLRLTWSREKKTQNQVFNYKGHLSVLYILLGSGERGGGLNHAPCKYATAMN